jgi:hypothetical protein
MEGYYLIQGTLSVSKCPLGACQGGNLCGETRRNDSENFLCAHCSEGMYEWGGICGPCDDGEGWIFWVLFVAFVSMLLLMVLKRKASSGRMATLVLLAQSAKLMMEGSSPTWFSTFTSLFAFEASDSAGSNCVAPLEPLEQRILALVQFPIYLAFLLLICLIHYFVGSRYGHGCRSSKSKLIRSLAWSTTLYSRTMAAFSVFSYTIIARFCSEYLNCRQYTDEISVVYTYPAIDCDSDAYKAFYPVVVIVFASFVLPFPFLLAVFLYRRRLEVESFFLVNSLKDPLRKLLDNPPIRRDEVQELVRCALKLGDHEVIELKPKAYDEMGFSESVTEVPYSKVRSWWMHAEVLYYIYLTIQHDTTRHDAIDSA